MPRARLVSDAQRTRSIAFVIGTRPELIKTAPVIHELQRRDVPFAIIHTGQHYTPTLDEIFFRELELPEPTVNLHVGSLPAAQQLARIISRTADALESLRPQIVLVQGDTNSVLGGALAAHKLGIPVAHLEAGLRSDDWSMPEEGNRVLAGRVAAIHFCPTALQAERLASEGIVRGVYVVGNTVVDASLYYAKRARSASHILERLGLSENRYALITLHRPSNVDDPIRLAKLLEAFVHVGRTRDLAIVFPVHPRTAERVRLGGMVTLLKRPPLVPTAPLGYLDTLRLLQSAACVLTDSGGIQEEACTLRVPCVTLRANTERPETVSAGANTLCDGADAATLEACVQIMLERPRNWENPLGDGLTATRVADVLLAAVAGELLPDASEPSSSVRMS